jgi:hypothetical protein
MLQKKIFLLFDSGTHSGKKKKIQWDPFSLTVNSSRAATSTLGMPQSMGRRLSIEAHHRLFLTQR